MATTQKKPSMLISGLTFTEACINFHGRGKGQILTVEILGDGEYTSKKNKVKGYTDYHFWDDITGNRLIYRKQNEKRKDPETFGARYIRNEILVTNPAGRTILEKHTVAPSAVAILEGALRI